MNQLELDYGQILLDGSYISAEQFEEAKQKAYERDVPVLEYLLAENIVSKDLLGQAIAEYYQVPYADLDDQTPSPELVSELPLTIAKKYKAAPFKRTEEGLLVATANPSDEALLSLLQENFPDQQVTLLYGFPEAIEKVVMSSREDVRDRVTALISEKTTKTAQVVDALFREAVIQKASDIHFDPHHEDVVVRFRIDGVMHEVATVPVATYSSIGNRIKILSNLRIDEHLTPQDGALQFLDDAGAVTDMRVSVLPTLDGEKIVLRIFDSGSNDLSLRELGYTRENEEKLIRAAAKPFGMILVTGPTGSGKTTTLYTLLRKFNTTDVNVMTIEDPVEYRIKGLNQVQVSNHTGLTFAKGLRSLLRQDPDVLLVGEVRDQETADIAVNAALTGHMLFSTFHSNDAATAFPRLIDMGIEPFLLASTVEVVIGQRLVRKLCESCRFSYTVPRHELNDQLPYPERFFPEEQVTLYDAKGCAACSGMRYRGRSAVVELIENTAEMGALLTKDPTDQEIWRVARANGSQSLFEDGIRKVRDGLTTLDELLRVAQPPAH